MRWKTPKTDYPKCGDKRIVTRFLLFPKEMEGVWRWLEKASWAQEYQMRVYSDFLNWGWYDLHNEGWMNR